MCGSAAVLVALVLSGSLKPVEMALALVPAAAAAADSVRFAGAGEMRGWPIRLEGSITTSGPAIGDIDNDGIQEIVIGAGLALHVILAGGGELPGWPLPLAPRRGEKAPAGGARSDYPASAALCDLDGRPGLEIVVLSLDGQLHVYDRQARELPGFPVEGGGVWATAPTCADLDGDAAPEVVWAGADGLVRAVRRDGKPVRGFPLKGLRMAEGLLAVGDLSPQRGTEVAFGSVDGTLHVLGPRGNKWAEIPGFPLRSEFTVSGGPVMADLNADGELEIAFGSQDFRVFAANGQGVALPNYPVKTGYRIYAQPAVGDLDGDGRNDVLVAAGDGNVYALNHLGQLVPGWPVETGKGRVTAAPAVGDLDGDGRPEAVICGGDGRLHVVRGNGAPMGGFPLALGGPLNSAPALADLDGDGRVELVVATGLGVVHAWSFVNVGGVAHPVLSWPTAGHDAGRVSRTRPNPALYRDVAVAPAGARTTDDLGVRYTYVDLDGDPERDTQVRWFRDGVHVPELDNKPRVPAALTRKGQTWRYTLQDGADFRLNAEKRGALFFSSQPLTVRNTPPTQPVVSIQPGAPSTVEALETRMEQPATDADGDAIQYAYRWFKDRVPQLDLPLTASRVDAARTRKGETWRVVVVPTDGTEDGPGATASVTIRNTPPSAAALVLSPAAPGAAVPIQATLRVPSTDADDEPITYVYRWQLGEDAVPFVPGREGWPALAARRGQVVTLTVIPRDSEADGPATTARVTVVNTPPPPPIPVISPAAVHTGDALWAGVAAPSADPDGDAVDYAFAWSLDGAPLPLPPGDTGVPAGKTRKGQRYTLTAQPADGASQGSAGKAELAVLNSAPGQAQVGLEPALPRAGDALQVVVHKDAPDVDGDAVTYRVRWLRTGQDATAQARDRSVPAGVVRKGEVWQALVTARDAQQDGAAAATVEVRVGDTPPDAPQVALDPARPRTAEVIRARITRPASDVDGDAVTYRYRWFQDGMLQDLPAEQDQVPPERTLRGQTWRVVVIPVADGVAGAPAQAEATVINTPPAPPQVRISPERPDTQHALVALVTTPATDPDDDRVSLRFKWFRNGADARVDGPLVPPDRTHKGDTWTLVVVPSDGKEDGAEVRVTAAVVNTPPAPPQIVAGPPHVKVTDVIDVRVVKASTDADGDPVKLTWTWTVDGKDAPALRGKTRLGKGDFKRGQTLRVVVTPDDGSTAGRPAQADILVDNTLPTAPQVRFASASIAAPETLKAEVAASASDADRDHLSYRYRFYRNGVHLRLPVYRSTVPAQFIRRGDSWQVEMVAFDGVAEGPPAYATAVIVNAPPAAPRVAFRKAAVPVTEPLQVDVVEPAADHDGDAVSYRYRYLRNGTPVDAPTGARGLPRRLLKKGDAWRVEVVAFDGWLTSAPATAEARVVNTPPDPPQIRFAQTQPSAGDRLDVEFLAPAVDADGDPVTYRLRYLRNGAPVNVSATARSVPGRLVGPAEAWQVEVTASDGEGDSVPATAQVRTAAPPLAVRVASVRNAELPGNEARPEGLPPAPPPPSPPRQLDPAEPFVEEREVRAPPPLPVVQCTTRVMGGDPARAGSGLRADVSWDGAAPAGAVVGWLRNGIEVARDEVPPGRIKKGQVWQAVVRVGDQPVGACRERVVADTPPVAPGVVLDPATPRTGQPLSVRVAQPATDVDGEDITYRYRWYLDDEILPIGEAANTVPGTWVRKGGHFRVEVFPVAAEEAGPPGTASATVVNTAPAAPDVVIVPPGPRAGQQLQALLRTPAVDIDGDAVTVSWQWLLNGVAVPELTSPAVPAGRVRRGETWAVTVRTRDADAEGASAQAATSVLNTPPEPPVVTVGEPFIRAGGVLALQVLRPAADADGDVPRVHRRVWVDGRETPEWSARDQLGWPDLRKNQTVRWELVPDDGNVRGHAVVMEARTLNTPPSAPAVAFARARVQVHEPLRVTLTTPAADVDQDALTYRYRYFRNGALVRDIPHSAAEVPAAMLHKGERWRVVAVAFDGEVEGPPAQADAEVYNTLPAAPGLLEISPHPARTDDALECQVRNPARDADGDPLRYVVRWSRNGVPTALLPDGPLPREATTKGEQWSCTAAAHDGEGLGPWRSSAPVTVVNSAPRDPVVVLTPAQPQVGQSLACRVAGESTDPDGDSVRYTFHWLRNGRSVPALEGAWDVPGTDVRRGDRWECWASATDGHAVSSDQAPRASAVVGNTPPRPPLVEIRPDPPRAGQPLRCNVVEPATDPDGDRVSYRVEWLRNGQAQGFAPTELVVAARHVEAGQEWQCLVTASDGNVDSESARSPAVQVNP